MRAFLLLAILFCMAAPESFSQATDATLSGAVVDPTRAAIPGARISAQNTRTGVVTSTATNQSGLYLFAALPPGVYRVSASVANFKNSVFNEVILEVGARLTLDFRLELSSTAETVEVSAEAESSLGYATSSIGGMVTARKVLELPVTSRNALGLVALQAGVVGDNFAGARIGALNIQAPRRNLWVKWQCYRGSCSRKRRNLRHVDSKERRSSSES